MKKNITVLFKKAPLLVCVVFMFSGCVETIEMTVGLVKGAVELGGELAEFAAGEAAAAAVTSAAKKDKMPLYNMRRISKGVYTVNISAILVKYKEDVRNNAMNLFAQSMGYDSYDFKMTKEPDFKKKTYSPYWEYHITMPGSIPVVRDEQFTYRIADTAVTAIKDTTFDNKDENSSINGIVYGDGKFVIVGRSNSKCKIAYSPDGVNWTDVKPSISDSKKYGVINSIAYGDGKFVAVGWEDKKGKIAYSPDGVNWTAVKTTTFGKDSIGFIFYSGGLFIARAMYENKIAYSSDGVNWTAVKSPPFKGMGIVYGNGTFVAYGWDDNKMAYSQDGVKWTAVKPSPFSRKDYIRRITYEDGKFFAYSFKKMAYSQDGVKWTDGNNELGFVDSKAYGNGKYVNVDFYGKNMAYSSDGLTWTTIADISAVDMTEIRGGRINGITYANGKFFVFGNFGKMGFWDGNIE